VVATVVAIFIKSSQIKAIHFDILIEIHSSVFTKSFSLNFQTGEIVIIPGFNEVTVGICHGFTVTSPISVGKIILSISPSNIIFSGLEIFKSITFS
jgi:hypothetical protein